MTSSNLERLAAARQLKPEPPSRREFEGLLRLGRTRLEGARKSDLALESRFDLGYGAAHALSQHWRVLALCHERRNAADYGGDFNVDEKLMAELLKVTDAVLAKVNVLEPPK